MGNVLMSEDKHKMESSLLADNSPLLFSGECVDLSRFFHTIEPWFDKVVAGLNLTWNSPENIAKGKAALKLLKGLYDFTQWEYGSPKGGDEKSYSHSKFSTDLTSIRQLIKDKNIPRFYPEVLDVLQLQIIFSGIAHFRKELSKILDEKEVSAEHLDWIRFELSRFQSVINTAKFCQTLVESRADTLVISVGSWGGEQQQQCPNFCNDLSNAQRVDVLNIDPAFQHNGFLNELSSKNRFVYYYAGRLGIPKVENVRDEILIQKTVEEALNYLLEHTHKKIILINHTSPVMGEFFHRIGNKFNQKIGNQLEIVGNTGWHNSPVFLYNSKAFQNTEYNEFLKNSISAWEQIIPGKYKNGTFDYEMTKEGENPETWKKRAAERYEKQLAEWQNTYAELGKVYLNLKSIPASDLFRAELEQEKSKKLKF